MIEKLLALQEHDIRISEVEKELQDVPARQQQERSRLEEHKANQASAEESLKVKQAEVHQLDVESQSYQAKITKLRQQQMQLKSNKEFSAMQSEIAAVEGKISELEDRELELMEEVEAAKADVVLHRGQLEEEEQAVAIDCARLDARAEQLREELAREQEARRAAAAGIEPAWLGPYDRLVGHKHPALVPLAAGICGGCHMKLPPAVHHETLRHKHPVSCNYCGRLVHC